KVKFTADSHGRLVKSITIFWIPNRRPKEKLPLNLIESNRPNSTLIDSVGYKPGHSERFVRKRQRAAALHDASRISCVVRISDRSWSAAALCRFQMDSTRIDFATWEKF